MNLPSVRTIDKLLEDTDLTVEDISEQSNLPMERVEAIALGRWTPSPLEREKIASAFGVQIEKISWGHSLDPRNLRYRRFGLREEF